MTRTEKQRRIKAINKEMKELKEEVVKISKRNSYIQITMNDLLNEQLGLAESLDEPNKKPTVSEHAVVRYMERVMGFDIESLREKILTPTVMDAMKCGATKVKADNMTVWIKGNEITTIT